MEDNWAYLLSMACFLVSPGALIVKSDVHKQLKHPDKHLLERLFTRGPVNFTPLLPIRRHQGRENLVKTGNRALIIFYISSTLALLLAYISSK